MNDPSRPSIAILESIPWEGKAILLLDLDAFFASVEQLDHPEWRGKPVIVGGDPSKRGVVSTASYEARVFGVHSAMPSATAARLCPDAIWSPGHFERYRSLSRQVMEILAQESPFLQQVSIDEAFLDITPSDYDLEHPVTIANRIQQRVKRLGITCSIGLGVSKSVAKIASDMDKPEGFTVVFPGREQEFLAPLPVAVMSGIGPAAQESLRRRGVTTLGELAQADAELLRQVFGKNAEMMRDRCLGRDRSPVKAERPVKSISNELSFAEDLRSSEEVEAAIATMASKVARRLRKKGLRGSTLMLKLRFEDLSIKTAQKQLAHPSDDEYVMIPHLTRLLHDIWREGMPLRLVGVAMSHFDEEDSGQEMLFDDGVYGDEPQALIADEKKREGLIHATDLIRDRFGEQAVRFGREQKTNGQTTGSGPKNPEDYK